MSSIIGRVRTMGIALESTKGTAVVPAFWLPVDKFDPNPIVTTKVKDGAIGRIEDAYDSEITSKRNEPSIEGYVTDLGVGLLLLATLGTVSKTTVESGVIAHAFDVQNDADHPSLTVSFKDTNMQKRIAYSMVNEFRLDAKVDDYLRFGADFSSKFEADTTGMTPAFTDENIFVARHVSVKIANDLAGLTGATAKSLTSVSVNFMKNLETVFGLGSNEPQAIYNKEFQLDGMIESVVADDSWRDLFIDNTTKAMRITIENTDVTIGLVSHPKIVIDIARVKFNPYKESSKNSDLITEQVSFKGMFDLTAESSVEVTLTNTVADYEA